MIQHRALLVMLIVAKAGTAAVAAEVAGGGTPSPVNLTASRFIVVKDYAFTPDLCQGPPKNVVFLLRDTCMPVRDMDGVFEKYTVADAAGGGPATMYQGFYGAGCETGSEYHIYPKVTSTCSQYCGDGVYDCDFRQATFDAMVGTAYLQYFNTGDCSDQGGPFMSSFFAIEYCMPVAVARDAGFLVGTDAARSVIMWSYPDGLYTHTFVSENCSGEEEAAKVSGGRTGWAQGGVCTTFLDGEELNGAVSYKLWTHKRSARAAEPRCAWVTASLAEEKKMIKHPNPDSCDCKRAGCTATANEATANETTANETVTP